MQAARKTVLLTGGPGSTIGAALMSKLGEANFVDGTSANGLDGMTPAAAKARIAELMADKEWAGKYIQGGSQSAQGRELDALQRIVASSFKPQTV